MRNLDAMNIIELLRMLRFIPEPKLLQLYPPFFFIGLKVLEYSKDLKRVHVRLPMRWYTKNMHGTFFGGVLTMVCDPFPAIMIPKYFSNVHVWTKQLTVEFLRPSRSSVDLIVEVTEVDCRIIQEKLDADGSALHDFHYCFMDSRGREIARVKNTVYIRKVKILSETSS